MAFTGRKIVCAWTRLDVVACYTNPIPACEPDGTINGNYPMLPADTDLNKFTDTMVGFYAENKIQWSDKFRSVLAFRGDEAIYHVTSLTPPYVATELRGIPGVDFAAANSGTATKFLPSPKGEFDFRPVVQGGVLRTGRIQFSQKRERGGEDLEFAGQPTFNVEHPNFSASPNQRRGIRCAHYDGRTSAKTLAQVLAIDSELSGCRLQGVAICIIRTTAMVSINRTTTRNEHLVFDLDMADSRARFTEIDPDDAALSNVGGGQYPVQGPGGKLVPEAVRVVISSGVTLHDYKGFTSTIRLRYFGPRDLTSDGINRSASTLLLNMGLGYKFNRQWRIAADFLNLSNRRKEQITYAQAAANHANSRAGVHERFPSRRTVPGAIFVGKNFWRDLLTQCSIVEQAATALHHNLTLFRGNVSDLAVIGEADSETLWEPWQP